MPSLGASHGPKPWTIATVILLLFIVILTCGMYYYESQRQLVTEQVTSDLASIGNLKTREIASWRAERLTDAMIMSQDPLLRDLLRDYRQSPDSGKERRLQEIFSSWRNATAYPRNMRYIDPGYTVRVSLEQGNTSVNPYLVPHLDEAARSNRPVLTSFTRNPDNGLPVLYTVAPVTDTRNGRTDLLGFIVLDIDPSYTLYPLIRSWPVQSDTAETLLVERYGDKVLFLNDLRHQQETAMNLTIPLTEATVPAVRAVLGDTGTFFGKDYRGVEVISVIQPVPKSPWYMVAKVDRNEAFSSWQSSSGLIIALVAGTLAISMVIIALLWQRRQRLHYRELYITETKLRKEEERSASIEHAADEKLRNIVDSIPDAMVYSIRIFPDGRRQMEYVAGAIEKLHGCTADEALADAERIYRTYADDERQDLANQEDDNFATGREFSRVIRLKTPDGSRRWVYARSKPRPPLPDGSVVYDGVELEITSQILAQDALARQQLFTATTLESIQDTIFLFNPETSTAVKWNSAFRTISGYSDEEIAQIPAPRGWFSAEDLTQAAPLIERIMAGERVVFQMSLITRDGRKIPTEYIATRITDPVSGTLLILATGRDLSERRKSADALRESEKLYRSLFENLLNGFAYCRMEWNENKPWDFTYLAVNKSFGELTGLHDVAGKKVTEVIPGIRETDANLLELYGRVAATGVPERFEIYLVALDMWFSTSVYSPGKGYFVAIFDVITERKRAEEILRVSEERFRGVFDQSSAGKSLTSAPEGKLLKVNKAFADMLGYTVEELQQVNFADITYPEDLPKSQDCIRSILNGERVNCRMEKRYICRSGTIIWADVSTTLLSDREGRPLYFITTIIDITRRKETEEEIRSANAFLDLVIDMSPFAMWISDQEGTIRRVNQALCKTIGLTPEEIVGLYNVFHDKNLESGGVMPDIRAVFEQGKPARFSIPWKAAAAGADDFARARDMYIDVSMFPIMIHGRVTNVVCQWIDISEQKRIETLIRNTNEILSQAQALAHVGSWEYSVATRAVTWSDETYRIFGYEPGTFDLTLENIRRAMHPDDLEKHDRILGTAAASGYYEPEVYRLIRPDGKVRTISGVGTVIRDESGSITRIIGVIQDITDRKLAEDQREELIRVLEQKNAELERFTYTVSHDLKSPLITIRGFSDLLESDAAAGETVQLKQDIKRIRDAADMMQQLLSDVLELARIGRIISQPSAISLTVIAREAVNLLAGPLADRGVTVRIDPGMPDVYADHARIREVLVNLIENAIKYMGGQEDPVIRIGVEYEGSRPVFFVGDNGIGIDSRYRDRIFNLFEKLNPSSPGTGVGLAIVKRIIEVHNGKIWAESEGLGKGTTFRFTLPPADDHDTDIYNNKE